LGRDCRRDAARSAADYQQVQPSIDINHCFLYVIRNCSLVP
jgi:hypothetical protein